MKLKNTLFFLSLFTWHHHYGFTADVRNLAPTPPTLLSCPEILGERLKQAESLARTPSQQALTTKLASLLHDEWRAPRYRPETRDYEPRIKDVDGQKYDIANLSISALPEKFKYENQVSAEVIMDLIFLHITHGGELNEHFIEAASSCT